MNQTSNKTADNRNQGALIVSCPEKQGIIAAITHFLYENGANILHSDQFSTNPESGQFFMRVQFQMDNLTGRLAELRQQFFLIAEPFRMEWKITHPSERKRLAVFVSKEDHCLRELLWRWSIKELNADIVMVVSNHPDMEHLVTPHNIPYYHVPVTKENREEAADIHLELLEKHQVDTLILARYMQIIPGKIIDRYPNQIINIHHSFLPAFIGGKPYHQAFNRGVKLIGATAHYVTEDLDEGPIIEQDVSRVNHRHHVADLKRIGRDLERIVLAKAVQWHINDQIIVHNHKTIVFE
ncbi:formyltetrahydrofolate deformylase [Thermoactinomyces sp. CICC 23799]|uniref:formyltetrahydrofolate deformylase n=1 Tax=Thermoactinomyces sp. CICC 23799 TaxID=2767429 RepID=UPI0018DD4B9B|nr:formyltetrahydrofolate deformylase [Thermoactinomyces sp. CICC 23799]MBH8599974.1 formyltetrahydrofolate deformylase [Thermoactinomyces sp. CICC 23799]